MSKIVGNFSGKLNGVFQVLNTTAQNQVYNLIDEPIVLNFVKNGENRYIINGTLDLTRLNIFSNNIITISGVGYLDKNTNNLNAILTGTGLISTTQVGILINMNITSEACSKSNHAKKLNASVEFIGQVTTGTAGLIGSGAITAKRL